MNIALFEGFYAGSHKRWADEWKAHSTHHIELFTLSAAHWKWRMHGGAITLVKNYLNSPFQADHIVCTDMIDLALVRSLLHQAGVQAKCYLYFHENQLTYPFSATDSDRINNRDRHYAFINYTSALAADGVAFNSRYHQEVFLEELTRFLTPFPDHQELKNVELIAQKSTVLYPGMLFPSSVPDHTKSEKPRFLWNHRWEFDKNPEAFFRLLIELQEENMDFELVVMGEQYKKYPAIFDEAKEQLIKHIVHWGYAESREDYLKLVASCTHLPVTSNQDFFGYSIIEAAQLGVHPILPNRLTYPEHSFPEDHYYTDESELKKKLQDICQVPIAKRSYDLSRYEWKSLITAYDHFFGQ
ncbi:MAG: tRNA-queuosine alpha-mannosyltransferase domain-containing protein [Flavobacteriales bacterium]